MDLHGVLGKIKVDKINTDTEAIVGMCSASGVGIELRQPKHLNHLIGQDHRAINRVERPMLGLKSLRGARAIIREHQDPAHG